MHKNAQLPILLPHKMVLQRNLGEKLLGQCPVIITTKILVFMIKRMKQKVQSTSTYVQHALQMGGRLLSIQKLNVEIKVKNLSQKTNNSGYRSR